jgi:hypothetical protein
VLQQFGHVLNEEAAKEIWQKSVKRKEVDFPSYNIYGWDWRRWNNADLKKIEVDMYYFEVKTTDYVKYDISKAKNGNTKVKKLEYGDKDVKGTSKNYWAECWYGGYFMEGMQTCYDWRKLFNQRRDQKNPQKAYPSLCMYRYAEKGLTEQVIALADSYQEAYLRRKHAILKSLPRGYSFNWDALSEIPLGDGGKLTQLDLIRMYTQTGSMIHRSMNEAGDPIMANANAPHMILENGIDPNIMAFSQVMSDAASKIALTMGINPQADALNPNPETLVGVAQQAQLASANSRHFLYSGWENTLKQTATYLSMMIGEVLKYNPSASEKLKNMIGATNIIVLESLDNLPLHTFGFYFDPQPTDQEKELFKKLLMDAYSKGQVDLSDVLTIYFVGDWKLARKMLNLKMRKRAKAAAEMQQQQMQMQMKTEQEISQIKVMIAQIAGKSAVEVATIGSKTDLQIAEMDNKAKLLSKSVDVQKSREKNTLDYQKHREEMATF